MTRTLPSVLLVDDDDAHRCLLSRVLRKGGKLENVVEQRSLAAAREFLGGDRSETNPSIIIVDLNLKDGRGTELLRFVRGTAALASVPVIVLSTSSLESDIQECFALGATDFITKTENLTELGKLLHRAIEQARNPATSDDESH